MDDSSSDAVDESGKHYKAHTLLANGRLYVNCDDVNAVLRDHIDPDCYCSGCNWMNKVFIPGFGLVTFEQEASEGLRTIPTKPT